VRSMFRASLAVARMLSRAFSVGFICVVGYDMKLRGFLRLLVRLGGGLLLPPVCLSFIFFLVFFHLVLCFSANQWLAPLWWVLPVFLCVVSPLCVCGLACWCFCSWRLCLWVVVCHPVGSSGSCFVDHVASWSLCCCSCLVSVVSDSSHLLYGVYVSFYCPVWLPVCVYCCVPCFSAWCCSCLLSVAVCSCLLSVHVFCGLCVKCCSGVLPPCLFTSYPFLLVFVLFFLFFR
jgi:hypothetical protein